MRQVSLLAVVATFVFALLGATGQAEPFWLPSQEMPRGAMPGTVAPEVQAAIVSLPPGQMVTVIVTLKEQTNLRAIGGLSRAARLTVVIKALQATANATQAGLRALLETRRFEGRVGQATYYWVFNGLAVTATSDVIQELATRPEVLSIAPNTEIRAPASLMAGALAEPNVAVVNAPRLWDLGIRGQGIVVANMDTGVDVNHPDLSAQWRGGTNSWFDPNGQHSTTPTDVSGHGTWTMGVTVGRDAGGTTVGMAPDARWIAVKIFSDQGSATVDTIHQGFQWLLDPDGNPNTPDAPHVVNNSWAFGSPGCNLEFQLDLRALRAVGVVPVFAAGNFGPGGSTSVSPANNPEAFAVGASDNGDGIYSYSSRGPSACGETQTFYPEVVAPGVNVRTTDLYGTYYSGTGTSLAAAHAAGALALLLSAYPDLATLKQEAALTNSGVDLGSTGVDNDYGYGRLDVFAAYQWLSRDQAGATPTATATPTPAATPTPTPTPVPGIHIGDLDGNAATGKTSWTATVTIIVHDSNHNPMGGTVVKGTWSSGYSGTGSCATDTTGQCKLTSGNISKKASSVTFTVKSATNNSLTYQPTENHDPDNDSNGTSILIRRP